MLRMKQLKILMLILEIWMDLKKRMEVHVRFPFCHDFMRLGFLNSFFNVGFEQWCRAGGSRGSAPSLFLYNFGGARNTVDQGVIYTKMRIEMHGSENEAKLALCFLNTEFNGCGIGSGRPL